MLCVYFALQVAIRLLSSANLGLDEAEQIIAAQSLEWGYGPQPPLYSWLVVAFFSVFGKSLFALSLLKNATLLLGYLGVWFTAKRMGGKTFAALATASIIFLPQISWEAQRALSHSVLLFAAASWTVYVMLLCIDKPTLLRAAALGGVVAIGALAKFNYFFLLAAVLIGCLAQPAGRRLLFSRYAVISIGVAAVLLFMPALWMVQNQDLLFSRVHKFGIHRVEEPWYAGPFSLLRASISFIAVSLAVYLPFLFLRRSEDKAPKADVNKSACQFLLATLLAAITVIFLAMVMSGTTVVKDRWLQPTLFVFPVILAGWAWPRMTPNRLAYVFGIAGACTLAIMIAMPINMNRDSTKRPSAHKIPSSAIAERVNANGAAVVLGEPKEFVGAVGYHLEDVTITSHEYAALRIPFNRPVMLIWRHPRDTEAPDKLKRLYERLYGEPLSPTTATKVELPYEGRSGATFTYYELLVE
ncbi:ArnT family glycosyltransferase [Pseudovibrio sp. SPO723]|uniref:ArnT family glycosyltransferase n=1 Tax=Nesiotobacter zosterae TaxID=392721 RepID=UPI0029C30063|nr:glycosyltransferase family 39 protein [Pseudovibrio sp. SPO723]MDX5595014.1 glycosyltransferase family 39 protein [Pseudovibrio sp. SPO723]